YGIYRILRAAASSDVREKERQLLKMISNLKASDEKTLNEMVDIAEGYDVMTTHLTKQLFAATRFQAPEKMPCPTLILASIKDAMVDVRCSKALAERFGATIKFHPSAGHDLTLDDPDWAAERIHEFMAPPDQ